MNFHAYGPLWIYPFNYAPDKKNNRLRLRRPRFWSVFQEFQKTAPKTIKTAKFGNGWHAINYDANGESGDWMLHAHNIIAFTPEVANDSKISHHFWVKNAQKNLPNILRDFYPQVRHFIKMHQTSLVMTGKAATPNLLKLTLFNKGLSTLKNSNITFSLKLPGTPAGSRVDTGLSKTTQCELYSTSLGQKNRKMTKVGRMKSVGALTWRTNGKLGRRSTMIFNCKFGSPIKGNVDWTVQVTAKNGEPIAKLSGNAVI